MSRHLHHCIFCPIKAFSPAHTSQPDTLQDEHELIAAQLACRCFRNFIRALLQPFVIGGETIAHANQQLYLAAPPVEKDKPGIVIRKKF
jgi:hypothetical protein